MNRSLVLIPVLLAVLVSGCGGSKKSSSGASSGSSSGGSATVAAKEFAFSPARLSAKAGRFTVSLKNTGRTEHEFVLLKTNAAPGSLKVTGGRVSEAGSVGEIEETQAGATGTHTFDLKPGHYGSGMRGELTVH